LIRDVRPNVVLDHLATPTQHFIAIRVVFGLFAARKRSRAVGEQFADHSTIGR